MITTVVATVFVFGLLILVHELGHFFTAKWVGMRVDEFAIGFGPKLIQFQRGETLYSLRAIPLGGFNKIAGMDPDEEQDERSFQRKSIAARMAVIIAGSTMNLLLPIILFFSIFVSSGIDNPSNQPVIGNVFAGKPAAQAGLLPGDRILAVNQVEVESWKQFVTLIQPQANQELTIRYSHQGEERVTKLTPEFDEKGNRGIVGVVPTLEKYQPGLGEALVLAGKQTYFVTSSMLIGLWQMVSGQVAAEVAGPIGVAKMAGEVAQLGIAPLLQFAAFLSINLGLINLLPVPVLDGGHIVTLALEGLRGKPLSRRYLQAVQMVGFVLLLMLMVLATVKDIRNW